ncbi:aggrecan core protein [Brienomyrus brachyistius]|uniref:aggrecan core protein n=1 Tax=Brienomyrus brachyistius TaxID=42636 RepID=UPI0020B305C2|nr:aggrecan core protein [Brienomyrus brachyistius]
MWILPPFVALALLGFSRSGTLDSKIPAVVSRSCSYVGVFHAVGGFRYALDFQQAENVCRSLGTTLASLENITAAYNKDMEICRYGWISNGNVTILRRTPHPNCANNLTGILYYVNTSVPLMHFDAYCFDEKDLSDKNCSAAFTRKNNDTDDVPAGDDAMGTTETDSSDETFQTYTSATNEWVSPSDSEGDTTVIPDPVTFTEAYKSPSPTETQNRTDRGIEVEDRYDVVSTLPTISITSSLEEESDGITGSGTPPDESTPTSDVSDNIVNIQDKQNRMVPGGGETKNNNGSVPDWLIILLVVLLVVLIVLAAVAVTNRKRWCGKHQTLMITKDGGEGNGAAAGAGASSRAEEREQEMVTLMHKEDIQENGKKEDFTVIALEESPEKAELA